MNHPLSETLALGRRVRERLAKKIVFDRHVGLQDTVFLSSMGRSGSTFVSNVINHDNRCRVIFEPFHPDKTAELADLDYPLYLDPEQQAPRQHAVFENIMKGRIHSDWVNLENRTILPRARLIKAIRANLFLKWLHLHFSEARYILLLRHPCAVVDSWLNAGFGDGSGARHALLTNPALRAQLDDDLIAGYAGTESPFERLLYFWCIYNGIPLRQFRPGEIHLVFYENLVARPHQEIQALFSYLGREYDEAAVSEALSTPSLTTQKNAASFQGRNALSTLGRWQQTLSAGQLARADEILARFGLDGLYSSRSILPKATVAEQLLAAH